MGIALWRATGYPTGGYVVNCVVSVFPAATWGAGAEPSRCSGSPPAGFVRVEGSTFVWLSPMNSGRLPVVGSPKPAGCAHPAPAPLAFEQLASRRFNATQKRHKSRPPCLLFCSLCVVPRPPRSQPQHDSTPCSPSRSYLLVSTLTAALRRADTGLLRSDPPHPISSLHFYAVPHPVRIRSKH